MKTLTALVICGAAIGFASAAAIVVTALEDDCSVLAYHMELIR